RTVQAPGAVEAYLEVDISAEVVGKILEMPVDEGSHVKKGELLCKLDNADYRARVTSAEANVAKLKASLEQSNADLEKADRDFRRQTQLSEADATSNLELADYQTSLTRAKALHEIRKQELIQAEAALQSANKDLQKTVLESPIDGIVSQRFAKQGEVVVTGTMNNPGTRIMVISDLSKMQVRCRVNETDAPLVQSDQQARIFLQSDTQRSVAGHVHRVATKGTKPAGRDVVTFETLVLVDSDDRRVQPGMSANVEIEVDRRDDAIAVPVQSVVNRKRKDIPKELVEEYERFQAETHSIAMTRAAEYVPVIWAVTEGVSRPRLVKTGISDDLYVEIVRGLDATETVVSGPYRSLDQLKDGSKVKVSEPEKKDESKEAKGEEVSASAEKKSEEKKAGSSQ
ncbi:MAG: efflux RND transporter periplasmic adaptor subunit, partial [Planctomycetota bacterium]